MKDPNEDRPGIIITKKDNELVVLIDNESMNMRLQVNPWTYIINDYAYSIKNNS